MFKPEEHLICLKGKDYLPVAWRLVWFRSEHPIWSIETEEREITENSARFGAIIRDDDGRVLSTGTGSETLKDFRDYIEKAETKAIGRALATLGYGTQFAPELEEGERIVDSPIDFKQIDEELATENQIKAIHAIIGELKIDIERLRSYLKQMYQVELPKELTKKQASDFIGILKSKKSK